MPQWENKFDKQCFIRKILLIPNKFPMNCQQICKAIYTCSHYCHFLHFTKTVLNVFSFDKMSPLECYIYSAFQKKSTPLNFLLVSIDFKMPFNVTSDTNQSKGLKVTASFPLVHCILPALIQNVYHRLSTAASIGANSGFQDKVKDNIQHIQQPCKLSSYSDFLTLEMLRS